MHAKLSCIACRPIFAYFVSFQSIKIYILQDTYSEALQTQPRGKEQSLEGDGIENRHLLEGALDLLEVHSRFLDQPQKINGSALSQSGRMGPRNYREQRTGVYDGLHMKREGGRARADRKASSQTSTGHQERNPVRDALCLEVSFIFILFFGRDLVQDVCSTYSMTLS